MGLAHLFRSLTPFVMTKRFFVVFVLLQTTLPVFSQPGARTFPSLKFVLLKDSITGERMALMGGITAETAGRLLIEADPNDVRKQIYEQHLIIEVIHTRNTSALNRIQLAGLKEFERYDVLKALRPTLQPGDRIVFTFRMLADPDPFVYVVPVK